MALSSRLALEGQLVQETVLAQELSLAEERQTVKLQELSKAVEQASDVADEDLQVLRSRIQQLQFTCSRLELPSHDGEVDVLQDLKVEEEEAQQALRRQRQSEQAAHEELSVLRQSLTELKLQCDAGDTSNFEPVEEVVLQALRSELPEKLSVPGPSLSEVLEIMQSEREAVAAELREDQEQVQAWQKAKELSQTMEHLEEHQNLLQKRHVQVEQERKLEGQGLSDLEDLRAEAAALKAENQLLNRQQVEWRRSQSLMLRLAEEMQKNPSQVEPVSDEGPTAAELQLRKVLQSNRDLRQQIEKMQKEKEELIHGQRGFETFVRSRLPNVEMAKVAKVSSYPPSP
eukprot:s200_g14.t1